MSSHEPYLADGRTAGKKARGAAVDYVRLAQAMKAGRRVLRLFREERLRAVRQYVGLHYADGGPDKAVPVNLIARYVSVIGRALVPSNPRVMITARKPQDAPVVSVMQEWVNRRLVEMYFQETLHRWVIDAVFSLGIMKVGIAAPTDSAVSGWYAAPAGMPFAETIDLDDFVYDPMCKDFRQASFLGHRFRVPLDVAKNMTSWDKKVRETLTKAESGTDGRLNQDDGDERVRVVGQGWQAGEEREYEPSVELWEVYLPRLKKVVILPSQQGGSPASDAKPLSEREWLGPPCGPYHFLGMQVVPGNPMPKAPIQDLIDLHEVVNKSYRKLIKQQERQKEVLPVRGAQLDDGRNVIQASDGEMIGVDNADTVKPVSFGGPNPVTAQFSIHLTDLFSKHAGNLDLMSGSAPQSKTATQDRILAANSNAMMADMQERTTSGTAKVMDALCWFWWYHPQLEMEVPRSAPGVPDVSIVRRLSPGGTPGPGMKRNGRYEDLSVRIDPYSMVYRTPQERLQFLNTVVQGLFPLMPLLQQQGIMFDAQAYLKKTAEYADEPDVTSLFTVAEPPPQAPDESGGVDTVSSPKPANTTREYIRRSVGADTQAQRESDMSNAALSAASEMGE